MTDVESEILGNRFKFKGKSAVHFRITGYGEGLEREIYICPACAYIASVVMTRVFVREVRKKP